MARNLGCPNAIQNNIKDRIMCKLGEECSYQRYCSAIGGITLSYGNYSCLGRNKMPALPPKKKYPKKISRKKRRQLREKEKNN